MFVISSELLVNNKITFVGITLRSIENSGQDSMCNDVSQVSSLMGV